MKEDIDILLAKYFGGNASGKDMEAIEQWLSSCADNQAYFDEMTLLYAKLSGIADEDMPKPNAERAKKSFSAYMLMQNKNTVQKQKLNLFAKQWMFRAAGIAILAVLSLSVWKFYFAEHELVFATQLLPKQNTLSDQTNIKLAENSKITYSSNFGKQYRTIQLDGKATFKVGHAGKGPLQVRAGEIIIEDVGTVFEVSAYKDSSLVCVKVKEGQVHFYTKQNEGLFLTANQAGYYNKKTKVFQIKEPIIKQLSSGVIVVNLNANKLREAFDMIADTYGVKVGVNDDAIYDREITVKFEGEDLNMVLQVIAETMDLNVKRSDKRIFFSTKIKNE